MENLFTLSKKMILLGAFLLLYSCSSDEMVDSDLPQNSPQFVTSKKSSEKLNVFKGPEVTVGYGKVRSWISMSSNGFPNEIGIEMTKDALLNPERDKKKSPAAGATINIPMHLKATQATPFDHIGLNWNPHGHEPEGVFNVPHFDIHFYMISIAEQLAIPEWSTSTDAAFNLYPPLGYLPADYFTPPGAGTAEGQMGKHWLPVNLGDYLPFSKIMIYGSYNGKVNFIEPMITTEYLLSNEEVSLNYSQPEYFEKAGNYPTKYNIYHDQSTGKIYITLSDFVARN